MWAHIPSIWVEAHGILKVFRVCVDVSNPHNHFPILWDFVTCAENLTFDHQYYVTELVIMARDSRFSFLFFFLLFGYWSVYMVDRSGPFHFKWNWYKLWSILDFLDLMMYRLSHHNNVIMSFKNYKWRDSWHHMHC